MNWKRTGTEDCYRPFHQGSVKQSIEVLCEARKFGNISDLKQHLRQNLPQNSIKSRTRYARYFENRFFADGVVDKPLTCFVEVFRNTSSAHAVAFYSFCKAERLLRDIVAKVLFPCIDAGYATRSHIEDFIRSVLPGCSDVTWQANAAFQVLRFFNIAKVMTDRVTISVWPQPEDIPAFMFILHELYPEPGMHRVPDLVSRPEIRGMMWSPQVARRMLRMSLDAGHIAKLSAIDSHEHFTTKLTLDEMVERLKP